jgi:hypothetical protein
MPPSDTLHKTCQNEPTQTLAALAPIDKGHVRAKATAKTQYPIGLLTAWKNNLDRELSIVPPRGKTVKSPDARWQFVLQMTCLR